MAVSLSKAREMLGKWIAAEEAVTLGQSHSFSEGGNTRQLTRANLPEIAKRIKYWEQKIRRIKRGGIITKSDVPIR